jgi:GH15 family glucan-1,4-alpha-glucosidase
LPGPETMSRSHGGSYLPISDYALIGNRATSALVGTNGSIDWLCIPHLDSPSIFAAILDDHRGGRWRVRPTGKARTRRRYVEHSAVLETTFECDGGRLTLTDFFPVERGTREDDTGRGASTLIRRVACESGTVEVETEWCPRPSYARDDVRLVREGDVIRAEAPTARCWITGWPADSLLELENATVRTTFRLEEGERFDLVCTWCEDDPTAAFGHVDELLGMTLRWWAEWARQARVHPAFEEWHDLMLRSGVVLKLLTQEGTGAIAAAPTASLPEEIGGVRNWDYRYCWVRDSSLIARALLDLGHEDDAVAFLEFLETASERHRDPARIQVLYGLRPESRLTEFTLGHLDGYCGSAPVRIGNAAAWQQQHDIYGELLDSALELHRMGVEITPSQRKWLHAVAEHACAVWREPDRGIWEVRGEARHFVHSKVMSWVALDRAVRLAEPLGWADEAAERWRTEAEEIRRCVLERGIDEETGAFKQSFDESTPDAANLRIPIVGFLPADDPRVHATIDVTLERLTERGLVYRYLTEETEDGVGGGEGAFVICTFWLAHALALAGRQEEAREIFQTMAGHANEVGLFAEEVDPETGAFLGNFPQAFSHVGLINAAHALGACHDRGGKPAPPAPPAPGGDR